MLCRVGWSLNFDACICEVGILKRWTVSVYAKQFDSGWLITSLDKLTECEILRKAVSNELYIILLGRKCHYAKQKWFVLLMEEKRTDSKFWIRKNLPNNLQNCVILPWKYSRRKLRVYLEAMSVVGRGECWPCVVARTKLFCCVVWELEGSFVPVLNDKPYFLNEIVD